MGKVGMGGAVPQQKATVIKKEFANFTENFSVTHTFTAKCPGVIAIAVSSQFYGRKPNGMTLNVKKNGNPIAFDMSEMHGCRASVFSPKEPGDVFAVEIELRTSGADVGCDYWVSAMANEAIEFEET